jgi:hypothetical protein
MAPLDWLGEDMWAPSLGRFEEDMWATVRPSLGSRGEGMRAEACQPSLGSQQDLGSQDRADVVLTRTGEGEVAWAARAVPGAVAGHPTP